MFRVEFWIVSTLFCCGVIAGLVLSWPDSSTPASAEPESHAESEHEEPHSLSPADQTNAARLLRSLAFELGLDEELSLEETEGQLLRSADQFLLLGNHGAALKLIRSVLQAEQSHPDPVVLCRLALAEELRGNYPLAEKAYLQAIKRPTSRTIEVLGLTGLARVWLLNQKPAEAIELLSDILLQSSRFQTGSPFLQGEVLSLLATAQRQVAIQHQSHSPFEADGVDFASPEIDLEQTIEILQVNSVPRPMLGTDSGHAVSHGQQHSSGGLQAKPQHATEHASEGGQQPAGTDTAHETSAHESADQAEHEQLGDAGHGDAGHGDAGHGDTGHGDTGHGDAGHEEPAPQGLRVLARQSDDAERIVLAGDLEVMPLTTLLEQLSATSGLTFDFDERALERLKGRSKALHADQLTLGLILDALLGPIRLAWQQSGANIQIRLGEDGDEANWMSAARRTWEQFLAQVPRDKRTAFAHYEQGNLHLLQKQFDQAATEYQAALQAGARDNMAARIHLNQSRVNAALGRLDEAVALLYRAIDTASNKHITALAYFLISQLQAQQGDLEGAIGATSRAVSLSQEDPLTAQAVLQQARVYLLQNKPFAANQALFQQRELFQGGEGRNLAAFIGSLARYLGSELPEARRSESYRLVSQLESLDTAQPLSTIDRYLVARAWQALGFDELAVSHLETALNQAVDNYWRDRLLFELAIQHQRHQDFAEAIRCYEHLADSNDLGIATTAKLQIMEAHLELRQFPEAIVKGRELLAGKLTTEQQKTVLTSLGLAYRQIGEPYAAALCFAGMLPQENQPK